MKNEKQMIYEEEVDGTSESEEEYENEEESEIIDLNDEIEIPIEDEEKIKIKNLNNFDQNSYVISPDQSNDKLNDFKKDEINEAKTTLEENLDSSRKADKKMVENSSTIMTKNLINLDLNDEKKKEEAIFMLMHSDDKHTPVKRKSQKSIFNKNSNQRKHTSASKVNVSQMTQNNPELNLNYDFNSALNKVMKQMVQTESNDENTDLLKQLLLGDQYFNQDLKKKTIVNREDISEKVQMAIEKKNQKLENLKERMYDEFSKKCTFIPNPEKISQQPKRNLEDFIADQINFTKKKNEKINQILSEKEKSNLGEPMVPKINEYSKKIVEEKMKENFQQPSFMRLYQKKPKMLSTDTTPKVVLNKSFNPDRINDLYNDAFKKKEKIEEIKKKVNKNQEEEIDIKKINSKKFLLNKFIRQFREAIEELEESKSNNQSVENQKGETRTSSSRINFEELYSILVYIKMINKNTSSVDKSVKLENRLVLDIFSELKDDISCVGKEDLFIFLLGVLNFYEIFMIKKNKKKISKEENESKDVNETNKLQANKKYKLIKDTIQKEIEGKIISQKKYGGLDVNNQYLITLDKSNEIHKDFNQLSFNWNTLNAVTKKKEPPQKSAETFKPKIDKKSIQLSQQYRKKMESLNLLENDPTIRNDIISNSLKPSTPKQLNKKFIESQNFHKMKIEKEIAFKREEIERNERKNCTFKPKIIDKSKDEYKKENRFEKLYQQGVAKREKTNKNKDNIENEKELAECTFKPMINKKPPIPNTNNVITRDRDFEKFNERMKVGRYERQVKQALNERGRILLKQQPLEHKNNDKMIDENEIYGEDHDQEIEFNILWEGKLLKFLVNEGETIEMITDKLCEENMINDEKKEEIMLLIKSELSKEK